MRRVRRHPGDERRERGDVPEVRGHILDLPVRQISAHRVAGSLDQGRIGGDFDRFLEPADLQLHGNFYLRTRGELDLRPLDGAEALHLDRDGVGARLQVGNRERARLGRDGHPGETGAFIDSSHCRPGQRQLALVEHPAGNSAALLRKGRHREKPRTEGDEDRNPHESDHRSLPQQSATSWCRF